MSLIDCRSALDEQEHYSSVITVDSIADISFPKGDLGGEKGGDILFSSTSVKRKKNRNNEKQRTEEHRMIEIKRNDVVAIEK
jgi:hypothetical protein